MSFNEKKGRISPLWGQTVVVPVTPVATTEEIIQKAVIKHKAFNQYFEETTYKLLYPDGKIISTVPGSTETFTLKSYKEALGKSYQRITLYLCPEDVAGS